MANILENIKIDREKFKNLLLSGKLYEFEEELYKYVLDEVYDKLAMELLQSVSESNEFREKLSSLSCGLGMKKPQIRSASVQIRTGTYVILRLPYCREVRSGFEGSRYLGLQYWGVIEGASPSYYSQVSKFSVLCGSFEIVRDVFKSLHIRANLERIRHLSLSVSKRCLEKRVGSMLSKADDLSGKRVVISTDGGRIRVRQYKEEKNAKESHHKFDTLWKEPKLFVITVIDAEGKVSKKELPIYDATFGEDKLFNLLIDYLKALNINKASEVQFIADGALWIWNNAKKMLIDLGVKEENIVETLDYYHAVEHLKKMTDLLPKNKNDIKNKLFTECKALLWEGNSAKMIEKIENNLKRIPKKLRTEIAYFKKNEHRLDYKKYREKKWLCGSGIIESGVRRMINLRFKSASSFWKQENLEGLIFLRCALLSQRWEFVINSVTNF
jgi:hypothetical protein